MEDVLQRLSALKGGKGVVVYLSIVGILTLIVVYVGSQTYTAYASSQEVRAKIASMNKTIADHKNKVLAIKAEEYRPVKTEEVDGRVAMLMMKIKSNDLILKDFKSIAVSPIKKKGSKESVPAPYKAFSIAVSGEYEKVMNYLSDFHAGNALINIYRLEIRPENDGKITATAQYRMYVK